MQGGNTLSEAKWSNVATQLMPHVNICMLQGCGELPESATSRSTKNGIQICHWKIGVESHLTIIYLQNDLFGNLAIVTNMTPSKTTVIDSQNSGTQSPFLGAKINGEWFYSIQASNESEAELQGMVAAVAEYSEYDDWFIVGDFNREPSEITKETLGVVCPPNRPTQPNKAPIRRRDYMIVNVGETIPGIVMESTVSDHYPVLYNLIF